MKNRDNNMFCANNINVLCVCGKKLHPSNIQISHKQVLGGARRGIAPTKYILSLQAFHVKCSLIRLALQRIFPKSLVYLMFLPHTSCERETYLVAKTKHCMVSLKVIQVKL